MERRDQYPAHTSCHPTTQVAPGLFIDISLGNAGGSAAAAQRGDGDGPFSQRQGHESEAQWVGGQDQGHDSEADRVSSELSSEVVGASCFGQVRPIIHPLLVSFSSDPD